MVNLTHRLPTAEELPSSDETPVDNQIQNDIPNLLLSILRQIWAERQDWFFGVDMGIYHDPNHWVVIVPDGFLALDVQRQKGEKGRLSYVLWEENNVLPKLALEIISDAYNGEYEEKLEKYQEIGILYYVIYNQSSGRRGKYKLRQPLEVYKLMDGKYALQTGQSVVWMPEIGLGIGYERRTEGGWLRTWLYWYDQQGQRYLTPEELTAQERRAKERAKRAKERAELAQQQAELAQQQAEEMVLLERQQKEKLANYLRSLGINPDELS